MAGQLDRQKLRKLWERTLAEDGAERDISSLISVSPKRSMQAAVVAREQGSFAGSAIFEVLNEAFPLDLSVTQYIMDGSALNSGTVVASLVGPARVLLGLERTLLNFLQRLCGVATLTRRYVDAVEGTSAAIYDTRKTIPGWRQLDKYAVRCGGGTNHRMGLHDAVLIKDNHLAGVDPSRLAAAADMVREATALKPPPEFIEFEVDTLMQLESLLTVDGIDILLCDNFTPDQLRAAVALRAQMGLAGKVELEASGGVNLETVRRIAETGIERVSVGALTHSAPALDLAMDIEG